MPIPTPEHDEEEQDFVSRCMGNKVMNDDYPDQKQRAAICYSQWREKHPESKEARSVQKMNIQATVEFDMEGMG